MFFAQRKIFEIFLKDKKYVLLIETFYASQQSFLNLILENHSFRDYSVK